MSDGISDSFDRQGGFEAAWNKVHRMTDGGSVRAIAHKLYTAGQADAERVMPCGHASAVWVPADRTTRRPAVGYCSQCEETANIKCNVEREMRELQEKVARLTGDLRMAREPMACGHPKACSKECHYCGNNRWSPAYAGTVLGMWWHKKLDDNITMPCTGRCSACHHDEALRTALQELTQAARGLIETWKLGRISPAEVNPTGVSAKLTQATERAESLVAKPTKVTP